MNISHSDVQYYNHSLGKWIQETIDNPNPDCIEAICSLWDGESWESIVEKFQTEGATWIVWWQDGLFSYIKLDKESN